ncbi:hypothetical protein Gotur_010580 [Gossypium turneri]
MDIHIRYMRLAMQHCLVILISLSIFWVEEAECNLTSSIGACMAESAIAALNCSGVVLGSLPIRVSPSKTPVRPRAPRLPSY